MSSLRTQQDSSDRIPMLLTIYRAVLLRASFIAKTSAEIDLFDFSSESKLQAALQLLPSTLVQFISLKFLIWFAVFV